MKTYKIYFYHMSDVPNEPIFLSEEEINEINPQQYPPDDYIDVRHVLFFAGEEISDTAYIYNYDELLSLLGTAGKILTYLYNMPEPNQTMLSYKWNHILYVSPYQFKIGVI